MPKFRLLDGVHSEGGQTYCPGDIFDSASDLDRFNSLGSVRFERIHTQAEKTPNDDGLDDMSRAELQSLVEERGIELPPGYTRKEELLRTLRDAV
jgi:hypothetical protein